MFKLARSATNGQHDRLSFLVEMLVHTDLVQRVEVRLLLNYFNVLDSDKSGTIDMRELEAERARVVREETRRGGHTSDVGLRPPPRRRSDRPPQWPRRSRR